MWEQKRGECIKAYWRELGQTLVIDCRWKHTLPNFRVFLPDDILLSLQCDILMQEELKLGQQAVTRHTQPPSQTYRVQLSPDILGPLCHGLGHAVYRLALAMQPSSQSVSAPSPSAAAIQGEPANWPQLSSLQPALGLITGRVAYSVTESGCGVMLRQLQSLLIFADDAWNMPLLAAGPSCPFCAHAARR